MTYKNTMAMNKSWFHAGIAGLLPAGLVARLKNSVKYEIPTGYQDETGFHYGVKPAEREIKWPATW